MPKRTYQPHKRQRKAEHGFMKRNATHAGRLVLKRRRLKGYKIDGIDLQVVCHPTRRKAAAGRD